ncbi:MAG: 23S rRNA (adenine(2503)-C(2))-methyltransferase RlmN [candidate division WOR-3 bacterium]
MEKELIKSFTYENLLVKVREWGFKDYTAKQIFSWLWQKGIEDFSQMTDIAKEKREFLKANFQIKVLEREKVLTSRDGTKKFLLSLLDRNKIEAVFIPEDKRRTVCVSTQVGCPLGCHFCLTARLGFKRNLKFYEILDQVQKIRKDFGQITNVVFMGMGEPFLNFEEVMKAVGILSSDFGFKIGQRHITISTAGILEGIYRLAESAWNVKLAISLNSPKDEVRSFLMPINQKYPIGELIKSLRYYVKKKRRRITIEYVLIKGLNDQEGDALLLGKILRGLPSKINLIPFNPFPGSDFSPPSEKEVENFASLLSLHYPYLITIRKSRGRDILAGCGQLIGR